MLQQRLCRAEIKSTYQINRSFMGPWHGIVFFSWVVFFSPNSATKPSKPLAWGATVPVAKGCATWTNWAVASSMDGEPSLLGEPWAHTNPPLFASRLSTTTWFPRLAGPFFFLLPCVTRQRRLGFGHSKWGTWTRVAEVVCHLVNILVP